MDCSEGAGSSLVLFSSPGPDSRFEEWATIIKGDGEEVSEGTKEGSRAKSDAVYVTDEILPMSTLVIESNLDLESGS